MSLEPVLQRKCGLARDRTRLRGPRHRVVPGRGRERHRGLVHAAAASGVRENAEGGRLQLATSGGPTQFPYFFQEFSEKRAYPLGINIIFYAMTH